ncbi:CLUMA_CG012721, isoform A [Clunio marinus]|uniref:CLUMA_CG012721, isoform A n=1 Tax=Clunio marinus TaxID=568069 RepID=A0A1J1IGG5_9DIPT|nr:CLUMA_CG012721, isoform A [Clunio marinus]
MKINVDICLLTSIPVTMSRTSHYKRFYPNIVVEACGIEKAEIAQQVHVYISLTACFSCLTTIPKRQYVKNDIINVSRKKECECEKICVRSIEENHRCKGKKNNRELMSSPKTKANTCFAEGSREKINNKKRQHKLSFVLKKCRSKERSKKMKKTIRISLVSTQTITLAQILKI